MTYSLRALLFIIKYLIILQKNIERHIRHMNENDRAIQEQMANSCSSMARERERRNAEKLACIVAEEERIAEQEEIKRRHAQQLHAQHAQEQKERLAREVEEYKRLKEQEELTKAMFAQRSQIMVQCYDIVAMIKSCKDNRALNMLPVTKLKEFYQQIEAIDEKIRVNFEKIITAKRIASKLYCVIYIFKLFSTK